MATIKDVAKEAGVSTATVSRVINDNYPVHMDTREKVMEVIKRLNYKPNAVARGLKNKETFLVGMITPDIANPFFMEIAKGIESQIADLGYNIIFCSGDETDPGRELKMLEMLHEKQVDAVILDTRSTNPDELNLFVELGMKIVLIDAKLKGAKADLVSEDSYQASKRALQYAIEMGHQKIGIIKGNMNVSTAQERYKAYLDALMENEIDFNPNYCLEGMYDLHTTFEAVKSLLEKEKSDLPTMIFSSNNRMTEGALMAMMNKGFKVPEDISLISFGNIVLPDLFRPHLAVIVQRPYEIGIQAGKLLLKRLNVHEAYQDYVTIELEVDFEEGDSVRQI